MIRFITIFYWILAFVFLVGGSMQLLGILSNTVATLLIGVLMIAMLIGNKTKVPINYLPFLYLIFIIFISSIINSTSPILAGLYIFMFVGLPFIVYKFMGTKIVPRINHRKLFRFFLIVGVIQLPVLILQQTFSALISRISARSIAEMDVGFGTFFLANDHGLCFFLIIMIIILLYQDTYVKKKNKIWYVACFSLTVALGHSNISLLLLLIVFAFYFVSKLNIGSAILSVIGLAGVYVLIISIGPLNEIFESKFEFFNKQVVNKQQDVFEAQRKVDNHLADRTDIIIYYTVQELKLIGSGPYDYFNPIKGEFKNMTNFSQYIWFYNDIGIFGTISVIFIYLSLYLQNYRLNNYRALILILMVVYSLFTNTLSDLSFNIIFSYFLLKDSDQLTNKNHELSLHTIS
ncbi:MAG: hypothetical protein EOP47_15350 [Sphingobacteriaceae bacterium]|nr:MAG: hypothetical protein EOP47_15350 [Sphingobacteriaceae bacterium]